MKLYKNMSIQDIHNIEDFHKHVIEEYPKEAVGIVKNNLYTPLVNTHSDPTNNFIISKDDSFKLLTLTDYNIIHSHTLQVRNIDPRTPSMVDMESQKNFGVPFGIVFCDGENVSDVLYFGPPNTGKLLGREYIHNVYDCYTLGRDYYYKYFNIEVDISPRPVDWQKWNPHAIDQNYVDLGFKEVKEGSLQKGDVLIMAIGSRQPNHVGIFIEDDKFIHHLYQRVSTEDSVKKWNRQLVKVLRYA